MSAKPRVSYKLSPNEEAAILRSQRQERRKARLIQVREQEREAARKTREAQREKRDKEARLLQDNIQSHLLASHAAELAAVQNRYSSAARHIGLGHRQAQQIENEENRLHELRLLLTAKQRERAEDRHVAALREEMNHHQQRKGEKRRQVERLRLTREREGQRARDEATRLTSTHQPPIIMDLVADKGHRVRLREVEGYSSSYYHIPSCTVQRAASEEREGPDAEQMAELMREEMQAMDKQCSAVQEEQRELARLRHIHALNQVKMKREKQELLQQLKTLEREDRTLRQKALAKMPSNMYQPMEHRKEVAREQQRDMEQAFERLFVQTHGGSTHPTLCQIANQTTDPPSSLPSTKSTTTITLQHDTTPTDKIDSDTSLLERSTLVADVPDPSVRLHVTIPTMKYTESDYSYSSSMATTSVTTPSSLGNSLSMSGCSSAGVEDREHVSRPHSDKLKSATTEKIIGPTTQSDNVPNVNHGVGTTIGVERWKKESSRQPMTEGKVPQDLESSMDSVASPTSFHHHHQQRQQQQHVMGGGELSVSDLTPSEIQYSTEQTPVSQPPAVLPLQSSGIKRLVSMVHAQQQAWSQRMGGRHPLSEQQSSHHDLSQLLEEAVATPSADIPPSLPHLSTHSLSPSPEPTLHDEQSFLSLNTVSNRQPVREAWPQPSNPPTRPSHHPQPTHHSQTPQAIIHSTSHPLTYTTRTPQPPHTSLTPSAHPSSVLHHRPDIEPLSITTMNGSSMVGQPNIQQDTTLPYIPPDSLPHVSDSDSSSETDDATINSPSVTLGTDVRDSKTKGGLNMPVGQLTGRKPGEKRKENHALLSNKADDPSQCFPPVVQTNDINLSNEFSSLSDDVTANTLATRSSSTSLSSEPSPSLPINVPVVSTALPTFLQPFHASSKPYTPLPTFVTPYSQLTNDMLTSLTISAVPLPPSTTISAQPYALMSSQSNIVTPSSQPTLTPSTISNFTLTPVSFFPDPSPITTTIQDTESTVQQGSDGDQPQVYHNPAIVGFPETQSILDVPCPNLYPSGQNTRTPATLSRPDLSIATEDTDQKPNRHNESTQSQDTTLCPEMSTDIPLSLDTTPTHTTLCLPADDESDPSILSNSPSTVSSKPLCSKPNDLVSAPPPQTAQSLTITPLTTTSLTASTASAGSLQETFLRRKLDFVQQSQKRLEQMKTNASERNIQSSLKSDNVGKQCSNLHFVQHKQKAKNKTVRLTPSKQQSTLPPTSKHLLPDTCKVSSGGDGGSGKENRKRAVTFSSPVLCSSHSAGMFSPPLEHKGSLFDATRDKKKISTREMKLRNERFYNRLPEVRRKKLEEKRSATYELNRNKAKIYQEQVRAKMQKKTLKIPMTVRKPPFK